MSDLFSLFSVTKPAPIATGAGAGTLVLADGTGNGALTNGQPNGVFAALLASIAPSAMHGEEIAPALPSPLIQAAELIETAQVALTSDDLSDAEITDLMDQLVTDLGALFATIPNIKKAFGEFLAKAPALFDGIAVEGGDAVPPRALATVLPLLRQIVTGQPVELAGAEPVKMSIAPNVSFTDTGAQPDLVLPQPETVKAPLLPFLPTDGQGASPLMMPVKPQDQPTALTQAVSLLTQAVQIAGEGGANTSPTPQATMSFDTAGPLAPLAQSQPVQAATAVAPPTPSAAPTPPVDPQQILGQLRARVGEEGRIRVELRPEGLGSVEIDLAPDEAGQLRVVVRAENAAVLSALRGDREGLMSLLRDGGHAVDQDGLSFDDFRQSDFGRQNGGQDTQVISPVLLSSEAEDDAAGAAMAGGLTPGGVDLKI